MLRKIIIGILGILIAHNISFSEEKFETQKEFSKNELIKHFQEAQKYGIRLDTFGLNEDWNPSELPKRLFSTSMELRSKEVLIKNPRKESLYSLNDIDRERKDELQTLFEIQEKYGKFKLKFIQNSKYIVKQHFELIFEKEINLYQLTKEYSQHHTLGLSHKDVINIVMYIPNERTLIPNTPNDGIQHSSPSAFFPGYFHPRGYHWAHYSTKTPFAWDISKGSDTTTHAVNDLFWSNNDSDYLPVISGLGSSYDIEIKTTASGTGNWLVIDSINEGDTDNYTYLTSKPLWGNGDSGLHGTAILPYTIARANNDNLNTPGAAGGKIGACPECTGVGIATSGDEYKLDIDMLQNNVLTRISSQSQSAYGLTVVDHKLNMEAGIVSLIAVGNNIIKKKVSQTPFGKSYYDDGNNSQTWGPDTGYPAHGYIITDAIDHNNDVSILNIAALQDGTLRNIDCDDWATTNCGSGICNGVNPCSTPHYDGLERVPLEWNYSIGVDKFNIDTDVLIRAEKKGLASVDLVAPAIGLFEINLTTNSVAQGYNFGGTGTSQATPFVGGIVDLMLSVNKFMGEALNSDGHPITGKNVQKKTYDILTFTATKLVDNGEVPATEWNCYYNKNISILPIKQPQYLLQSNDKLKRWWAQRMGFGKVNAYRAVAHSIANKTPYEITTSTLPFASTNGSGDSRGYVNPDGKQLLHMGSKVKEGAPGVRPFNDFWLMSDDRGPTTGNDGILNVLDYGGVSIPLIPGYHDNTDNDMTNDHADYNNQGVTIINNSSRLEMQIGTDKILAIDGMLIGLPGTVGHKITSGTDGLILVEGYLKDVDLIGNLRVGDLIIDGSINSGLWFGNDTESEVYGNVIVAEDGGFHGGSGGKLIIAPGATINLMGTQNSIMGWAAEWHFMGASKMMSANNKLKVMGESKLYIDENQSVELDLEVEVFPCSELIVEKNAFLRIKKLTVHKGGKFTVEEGAKVTFVDENHSLLGINTFTPTSTNKITFRAKTIKTCKYDDDDLSGTTATLDMCIDAITDPNITLRSVYANVGPCDFVCPNNSLLVVKSKKDGSCPNTTDCRITHDIHIPYEYLCIGAFTNYRVTVTINGIATVHSIEVYDGSPDLSSFDLCLTNGQTYIFQIELMASPTDSSPCVLQQTLTCACDCPEEAEDWFTLISTKGGGGCALNECYVENTLEVPVGYPCYTHFQYSSKQEGYNDFTSAVLSLSGNNLAMYNKCIVEGTTYEVTLKLFKNPADTTDFCEITKSVYCELMPIDSTFCVPDCEQDTFKLEVPIMLNLAPDCPDCSIKITYGSREACDNWQDIQIKSIEEFTHSGLPLNSCSACSDAYVYKRAIREIIERNDMNFNPKNAGDGCFDTWRVSKASCWATWEQSIIDTVLEVPTVIRTVTVHRPCVSDCCLRRMEVCREGLEVTITDLGLIGNPIGCDSLYYNTNDTIAPMMVPCVYSCDMLEDWTETFVPKATINLSDTEADFNPINPSSLYLESNIAQTTNSLNIFIANSNLNEVKVEIYNLNGQLIASSTKSLSSGATEFSFDTSNYTTGTYLFNISSDGRMFKTDKFIILR